MNEALWPLIVREAGVVCDADQAPVSLAGQRSRAQAPVSIY
jgi:hypothetical protein